MVITTPRRPVVEYEESDEESRASSSSAAVGHIERWPGCLEDMLENTGEFDELLRSVFEQRCSYEELRELDEIMK
jgi:hypothetical protein